MVNSIGKMILKLLQSNSFLEKVQDSLDELRTGFIIKRERIGSDCFHQEIDVDTKHEC